MAAVQGEDSACGGESSRQMTRNLAQCFPFQLNLPSHHKASPNEHNSTVKQSDTPVKPITSCQIVLETTRVTKQQPASNDKKSRISCAACPICFSFLRRQVTCDECQLVACSYCTRRVRKVCKCLMCYKIAGYESQLSKVYFSSEQSTNGKRAQYPGVDHSNYRQWFAGRPAELTTKLQATHAKRSLLMKTLHKKHLLHSHRWKQVCEQVALKLQVPLCYITLADSVHELIVGSYGALSIHFSCFPREIGMCDATMGTSDQTLVLKNVRNENWYCYNPMLQAINAGFYMARTIVVDGTVIGAVAVVDSNPHDQESKDEDMMAVLQVACDAIGSRIAILVTPPPPPPSSPKQCFPIRILGTRASASQPSK